MILFVSVFKMIYAVHHTSRIRIVRLVLAGLACSSECKTCHTRVRYSSRKRLKLKSSLVKQCLKLIAGGFWLT